MRTQRTMLFAAAVAAILAMPLTAVAAPVVTAQQATTNCQGQGTIPVPGGEFTIQSNEWNSNLPQCVTYTGGTAWSVSTANFNLQPGGAPATYPSIFKGCHWGNCTNNSGLPIQVSNLGTAVSSWSTTQPASGAYDVAYDIWINSTPTTNGQPDGTEVMIWLNSRGGVGPFGSQTGTATVAGHTWNIFQGRQTSWNIISYVLQGGGTSFTNLDLAAMLRDSVTRGSTNPNHFLIDVEVGFEIWNGGQGLATNSFSFNATAGGGGGGPTGNWPDHRLRWQVRRRGGRQPGRRHPGAVVHVQRDGGPAVDRGHERHGERTGQVSGRRRRRYRQRHQGPVVHVQRNRRPAVAAVRYSADQHTVRALPGRDRCQFG